MDEASGGEVRRKMRKLQEPVDVFITVECATMIGSGDFIDGESTAVHRFEATQCFNPTETFQFAIASIIGMTSPAEVKNGKVKVKGEKTSKSKSKSPKSGGKKKKGQLRR